MISEIYQSISLYTNIDEQDLQDGKDPDWLAGMQLVKLKPLVVSEAIALNLFFHSCKNASLRRSQAKAITDSMQLIKKLSIKIIYALLVKNKGVSKLRPSGALSLQYYNCT